MCFFFQIPCALDAYCMQCTVNTRDAAVKVVASTGLDVPKSMVAGHSVQVVNLYSVRSVRNDPCQKKAAAQHRWLLKQILL